MQAVKGATAEDAETTRRTRITLVHENVTYRILSCAYRVHSRLGPGLLERPYRKCLCYELERARLPFEAEKSFPVVYEDAVIELGYRVDLLVSNAVIVEVKAIETILPVHVAQLLSYLRLSGMRAGLLINFNVTHLRQGIRRLVNERASKSSASSFAISEPRRPPR